METVKATWFGLIFAFIFFLTAHTLTLTEFETVSRRLVRKIYQELPEEFIFVAFVKTEQLTIQHELGSNVINWDRLCKEPKYALKVNATYTANMTGNSLYEDRESWIKITLKPDTDKFLLRDYAAVWTNGCLIARGSAQWRDLDVPIQELGLLRVLLEENLINRLRPESGRFMIGYSTSSVCDRESVVVNIYDKLKVKHYHLLPRILYYFKGEPHQVAGWQRNCEQLTVKHDPETSLENINTLNGMETSVNKQPQPKSHKINNRIVTSSDEDPGFTLEGFKAAGIKILTEYTRLCPRNSEYIFMAFVNREELRCNFDWTAFCGPPQYGLKVLNKMTSNFTLTSESVLHYISNDKNWVLEKYDICSARRKKYAVVWSENCVIATNFPHDTIDLNPEIGILKALVDKNSTLKNSPGSGKVMVAYSSQDTLCDQSSLSSHCYSLIFAILNTAKRYIFPNNFLYFFSEDGNFVLEITRSGGVGPIPSGFQREAADILCPAFTSTETPCGKCKYQMQYKQTTDPPSKKSKLSPNVNVYFIVFVIFVFVCALMGLCVFLCESTTCFHMETTKDAADKAALDTATSLDWDPLECYFTESKEPLLRFSMFGESSERYFGRGDGCDSDSSVMEVDFVVKRSYKKDSKITSQT